MRITNNTFNIIIFLGRPAAGKSEVIDYIKKQQKDELIKKMHISDYETLDDFVDLWEKGEEDDILEELGRQRLYTKKDPTGYSVSDKFLYKFLIKKINTSYNKKFSNKKDFFNTHTLFIEFSRGGIDAYKTAFSLLSEDILKRAVVFYTKVSFDESCRKNRRRYNPDAKDSILQHALPDYVMEVYRVDDWDNLTYSNSDYFEINNIKVPFYTFLNEPELTDNFEKLGPAVKSGFEKLKINAEKF
ncbi:hypothetical protein KA977_04865 [Candidatus Dependentiae bacterium]|nr:hypothetical protein [Candidatus Dependentiae bacterium]